MSERSNFSVNNESLLRNANINEIADDASRKIVSEIKMLCELADAEFARYGALQNLLFSLEHSEHPDSERIASCKEERNACLEKRNELLSRINALSNKKELQPLVKKLTAKAYAEAEELGRKALEEYKLQAIEHQKQVVQEWEKSRREAEDKWRAKHNQQTTEEQPTGKKRAQKKLAKVEEEIAEIRPKVDALFEEINKLRWCWFGKKKIEKEKLRFELSTLQSELSSLYQEKYRLENKLRK